MKKTAKILALCLTFVLAFALVACGGNEPDADMKSEKIADAQAWTAAFDYSEAKSYTIKAESTTKQGKENVASAVTVKYDNDKMYVSATIPSVDNDGNIVTEKQEMYYQQAEGKYYIYNYDKETKKWTKTETDDFGDEYGDMIGEFASEYAGESGFEKMKYDDKEKGYVAVTEIESMKTTAIFKFSGGKLVIMKVVSEITRNDETTKMEIVAKIYDVGKTSVTLPEATEAAE